MKIILLEKVNKLGFIGDLVDVAPGFARNFLLPQKKALRYTKENLAKFETEKDAIVKLNGDKKEKAEAFAEKVKDKIITIIRSASDSGHLYGSVNTKDIAKSVNNLKFDLINKNSILLDTVIKNIGIQKIKLQPHPEVITYVFINVARSDEEAITQKEKFEKGETLEENKKTENNIDSVDEIEKTIEAFEKDIDLIEEESQNIEEKTEEK